MPQGQCGEVAYAREWRYGWKFWTSSEIRIICHSFAWVYFRRASICGILAWRDHLGRPCIFVCSA
jgi:hypothetical protein